MRPTCSHEPPVPGYGDPAGDIHVIGDHPGVHGGGETGVPFTGSASGRRLQSVLHDVGLLTDRYADAPEVDDLFLSYLHMCSPREGTTPSDRSYRRLDRYFDAELRAVNAHILLPVGRRATDRVLAGYTTRSQKEPRAMDRRHARDVRGRGFLVVPVKEPTSWTDTDREGIVGRLDALLTSDYRQTKGVATRIG